jgi:hypothetical protein
VGAISLSEAQPSAQTGLGRAAFAGYLRGVTRRHHRLCFTGGAHWPLANSTLRSQRILKRVCREEDGGIVGQGLAEGCDPRAIGGLSRRRNRADHSRCHEAEFQGPHCRLRKWNLSRTLVVRMSVAKEYAVASGLYTQKSINDEVNRKVKPA